MSNLVLTRKKRESVIIYKDGKSRDVLCEIMVTAVGAKQVKLAFEANNNIRIDRKEVYEGNV